MEKSVENKLVRIISEAIERAEFDRKNYEDGVLYEEGYIADKDFNVRHTVRQIERLFNKGF